MIFLSSPIKPFCLHDDAYIVKRDIMIMYIMNMCKSEGIKGLITIVWIQFFALLGIMHAKRKRFLYNFTSLW